MIKKLLFFLLVLSGPLYAQNVRYDNVVQSTTGQGLVATVTICTSTATGNPCTPTAQIYADAAGMDPIPSTITTGPIGNYGFYAPPGNYSYTISGAGITAASGFFTLSCANGTSCTIDNLIITGTCTGCGGGTVPAFPVTVTGGVSGGIPCFTSATVEGASALLPANAIVLGGGAGVCPSASTALPNGTTGTTQSIGDSTSKVATDAFVIANAGFVSTGPSADYTFSVSGSTFVATNNRTGVADYIGTDSAVVINDVLSAYATVGGRLFFQRGVYNINSMTSETTTGCNNIEGSGAAIAYAVAFQPNTIATSVQWLIEGESQPIWTGEAGSTTSNTSGVIFNVTSTAISSVTAGSVLNVFWQRPTTNCTLSSANISNDVLYKNVDVRFPTNQRGNEIGFNNWFGLNVGHDNTMADFALPYNTIATGSAPTVGSYGSFGYTSTVSSSGNWENFVHTYSTGWNIAYDFQTEHVICDSCVAIYSNYPGEFGRSGTTVYHPIYLLHFSDQENANGFIFGPQMAQGSRVDLFDHDIEFGNDANWYTTSRGTSPKYTETNCGYTSGLMNYTTVKGFVGIIETPGSSVFTSCGNGIQKVEGTSNPSFALSPSFDTFTHPNGTAIAGTSGLGPAWVNGTLTGNNNLTIVGNAAQVNSTATSAAGLSFYTAQTANNDQFSEVTISILNTGSAAEVTTNASNPTTQTDYRYYCGGSAALGRGIVKDIAGTGTTLASQTSAGCSITDKLRLIHIGTTIWAFRNGQLDTTLSPNPVVDSSLSGGSPGIELFQSVTNGVAVTNWKGGSLPTLNGTDSIYGILGTFPAVAMTPVAFGSLPLCEAGNEGYMVPINNSSTATYNATISGTGSNHVTAYCNGTNWVAH